MNIGVLTSGGDAPGMNACIRAVVKSALYNGLYPFGVNNGYQGLIDGDIFALSYKDVDNVINKGGTFLGTARSLEFKTSQGMLKAFKSLKQQNLEALIVIGGDGSFKGAAEFSKQFNIPVFCIPGTIDNDIVATDVTLGYDTALNTIINAVDKIRDTANSHHRIFFVEVMGRDSGALALNSAIASGAEAVLIPEEITDVKQLAEELKTYNNGNRSSIIIVAEGDDAGGSQEIIDKIKPYLPDYSLRSTVLGHVQRGGSPSFFDRYLGTLLGETAIKSIINKESNLFLGYKEGNVIKCSLNHVVDNGPSIKKSNIELLKQMRTL